ncbi:MAG: PAS domain S-box protein [Anaerolineae bacterium]|nr:PAS domain S-box protein [Anaerolineae bacterium]
MSGNQTEVELKEIIKKLTKKLERAESDRQQINDVLYHDVEKYRTLFEYAPDAILLIDPHSKAIPWQIVACNRAACQMNGCTQEDLIGQSVDTLHNRVNDKEAYLENLRDKGVLHTEMITRRKDGSYVVIQCSTNLVELDGHEYVLGVDRDITAQKEIEAALNQRALELEERNRELDAFSHTIAHDLKSPLGTVLGAISILKDEAGSLSEDGMLVVDLIEASTEKMSKMIEDLLMLASIRNTDQVSQSVDVRPVVQNALERIADKYHSRHIRFEVQPDLPKATGYAPWLEEVFANLIDNAAKYIGQNNPEPTIKIRGELLLEFGMVQYEVEDNGVGIAEEDQEQLFEMFTRFHKREATGFGLGLSIVQRIIDKLEGEIGAASTPGKGTTIWFRLPASIG